MPFLSLMRHAQRHATVLVVLLLVMHAMGSVYAASPLRIRFSHVVTPDTPKGRMAERFRNLVAQRSQGRIAVEVFPNSSLYGDEDEFEALRLGAVEMLAPSLSKFGATGVTAFEVFDLPFLFPDLASVHCVTHGPIGTRLLKQLARQQMVGLGFTDAGFKHMSGRRALQSPVDYRGLRLRIQASNVLADQMRALGAQPVVLPFGETQRALAYRVVDGTENPITNFVSQGLASVQPAVTLTQHGYLGYAIVANPMFWDSLSAEDRDLIQQALDDALAASDAQAAALELQAQRELAHKQGVTIYRISASQRAALRQATQPAYDGFIRRGGEALVAEITRECLH
ncbi:DctP family TRAP transporter solute-binding subunit [Aquabacterium sp.]|uniref:DctP family TRAP transporter solute-binding subunit n=1 Tax=Aquabacterium sp. TaxID=1872578 RepID=UPI003B73E952